MSKASLITKALRKYSYMLNELPLDELYATVGLVNEDKYVWRRSDVWDYLGKEIKDLFIELHIKESDMDKEIRRLMTHFLYEHFKSNANVIAELKFLDAIHSNRGIKEDSNTSDTAHIPLSKIRKFVKFSVWYTILSSSYGVDIYEHMEHLYPKQYRYAKNMIALKRLDGSVQINEGEIINEIEVTKELMNRLEDRIARFGSSKFMQLIVYNYIKSYSKKDGLIKNSIPYLRLLWFLALKVDTDQSGKYDRVRGRGIFEATAIFRISDALEILHDNRLDNQFTFMFMGEPLEYLQRVIYHDALYKDNQYPPESVILLLRYIINDNPSLFAEKLEMSSEQFLNISQAIISYSTSEIEKGENAKLTISPADVKSYVKSQKRIADDVIDVYFLKMQSQEALNCGYDHPFNIAGITSDSHWLIPVREGVRNSYYLPLPAISCFGLYDTTMRILDFPNIGTTFENLVRKMLSDATHVPVYTGKFIFNKQVYESDGILVLGDTVLLIECKTKPLQRVSRSGDIGNAIGDLGFSLLYSALQAYRCELAYRKGDIALYDNSENNDEIKKGKVLPIHVLPLPDNPTFIRLSCTTFNYGTYIEKAIMMNLFEIFRGKRFSSPDKEVNKKLQKVNALSDEINTIWLGLKPFYIQGKEEEQHLFKNLIHRTVLMPLGLLWMYTNEKISSKDFIKKLTTSLHILPSDYNSYSSFSYFHNL